MDAGGVFILDQPLDLQVIGIVEDEVYLGSFHQQHRHSGVLVEIGDVTVLYLLQVFGGDVLFIFPPATGDVPQQLLNVIVQIKDEVRLGQEGGDGVEHAPVEVVLVGKQVVLGEYDALVDEIVANYKVLEHVAGGKQVPELLVAVHQEGHLHGEGVMDRVNVELGQERVVGETLKHELCVVVIRQHLGEGGLPRSNAPLYDYIIIWYHLSVVLVEVIGWYIRDERRLRDCPQLCVRPTRPARRAQSRGGECAGVVG